MNQRPRTIEEQVSLLRAKGMAFDDLCDAKAMLARISYFRLKYYWTDLIDESSDGDFLPDTSFGMVMKRYNFDHNFRLVLFDAIEMIEVAFRAKIIHHMSSVAGNGLWYLDSSLFEDADRHREFVLNLKYEFERSTEPFAKKYVENHLDWHEDTLDGDNPDAWMIIEVATFGTLSKMYKNLKNQLPQKSAIANDFGLYSSREFSNWIEIISLMRNVIAHHSRLWNRSFGKKMSNIKGHRDLWLNNEFSEMQKKKPYAVACALVYLCKAVSGNNLIKEKVKALFEVGSQTVPLHKIGLPSNWKSEPLWR